ncbi:MAG: hypothetical protein CL878_04695 [Dehalococcoidia bacterium]|nr:hypothetical protein [Dehalococcoidia bacterium]
MAQLLAQSDSLPEAPESVEPPIGIVVGRSSPQDFVFVSDQDAVPPRLEYVVIHGAREQIDDTVQTVDLLAQVTGTRAEVLTLGEDLDYAEAQTVVSQNATLPPRVQAEANVLGYLRQGVIRQARSAVLPGTPVYPAPDALLRQFFSRDEAASITLGTLINRRGVDVRLDPNGLSRHLAIIAQTGAGKSYLAGKLLEDLLGLGATIIVLDPNSDYVQLRKVHTDAQIPFQRAAKTPHADRIAILRVPGIEGRRYPDELVGHTERYTIRFAELDADDIADVAGVPTTATRIRDATTQAVSRLRRMRRDFVPRDLVQELADFAGVPLDEGDSLPEEPMQNASPRQVEPPDGDDPAATEAYFQNLRELGPALEPQSGQQRYGGAGAPGDDDLRRDARNAMRYVRRLERYPVWGHSTVNIERLIEPMTTTVIDLAGTEKVVMAYTAEWLLSNLWERALGGRLRWPVFVVLEEAHNLVPSGGPRDQQTKASRIINTVAAEGRKFGVYLIVITQRPSKIADDTLSQCASQLIMRLTNPDDQKAVQRASEVVSQGLLENLPGLNQGEVVALGRLTRIPAMVKVSGRQGAEGGADRDLAADFAAAHQEAVTQQSASRGPASGLPRSSPKRVPL